MFILHCASDDAGVLEVLNWYDMIDTWRQPTFRFLVALSGVDCREIGSGRSGAKLLTRETAKTGP